MAVWASVWVWTFPSLNGGGRRAHWRWNLSGISELAEPHDLARYVYHVAILTVHASADAGELGCSSNSHPLPDVFLLSADIFFFFLLVSPDPYPGSQVYASSHLTKLDRGSWPTRRAGLPSTCTNNAGHPGS